MQPTVFSGCCLWRHSGDSCKLKREPRTQLGVLAKHKYGKEGRNAARLVFKIALLTFVWLPRKIYRTFLPELLMGGLRFAAALPGTKGPAFGLLALQPGWPLLDDISELWRDQRQLDLPRLGQSVLAEGGLSAASIAVPPEFLYAKG